MERFLLPIALAACILAAPSITGTPATSSYVAAEQQPPKKKPAPNDSTRTDSLRRMIDGTREHDHRVDTTDRKTMPPGKVKPTAKDTTGTHPRR
ncbi:MAG TPA: hypothetical protein VHL57_09965 [Flavobacteriales bacterium]|nr:hypothetical protein [Flavobacteriales bacterium]